jgi:hypothetical protein
LKNQSQSSLGYTKNYKQPRQYWAKEQYWLQTILHSHTNKKKWYWQKKTNMKTSGTE